jgi:hypothetical protein
MLQYHLVMTNIAMENPNHKWRFIAGKIIYKWAIYTMAMLNNQRVYLRIYQYLKNIYSFLETHMKQNLVLSSALVFCMYMVRRDTCHPQVGRPRTPLGQPFKVFVVKRPRKRNGTSIIFILGDGYPDPVWYCVNCIILSTQKSFGRF